MQPWKTHASGEDISRPIQVALTHKKCWQSVTGRTGTGLATTGNALWRRHDERLVSEQSLIMKCTGESPFRGKEGAGNTARTGGQRVNAGRPCYHPGHSGIVRVAERGVVKQSVRQLSWLLLTHLKLTDSCFLWTTLRQTRSAAMLSTNEHGSKLSMFRRCCDSRFAATKYAARYVNFGVPHWPMGELSGELLLVFLESLKGLRADGVFFKDQVDVANRIISLFERAVREDRSVWLNF